MPGKVEFKANVPVEVALQFAQGRNVQSQFGGGEQVMYTTVDGRKMYLSPDVAAKIAASKPGPGARFRITKQERTDGGRGFDWSVESLGAGPQLDGTYVIPKPAPTAPPLEAPKPAIVNQQENDIPRKPPVSTDKTYTREQILRAHSRVLIDAQADAMKYAAEKHPGVVKSEDVRSIVLSVYIQMTRNGRAA